MTYSEAIAFLYNLQWFGTRLGLETTLRLAELSGNPHHKLRFIHVAGTNGKGSTCAMLESIYREAGLKVGLFTSPHLVSFTERIQINRLAIPQNVLSHETNRLLKILIDQNTTPDPAQWQFRPSLFEFATVMALNYFLDQKCDLVIWETGLGGRLDATNIVAPLLSVITNIQMDHMAWLGNTLSEIAFEKAGIIKPSRPIVTGAESPEALQVISKIALERNAPLTVIPPSQPWDPPFDQIELPLLGEHQRQNAAVALASVKILRDQIPVTDRQIINGFEQVRWAGRLQEINLPRGRKVLLDGAHNLDGVKSLTAALQKYWPGQKPAMILGIFKDKQWRDMCHLLAPFASAIYLAPVQSERSADPAELLTACLAANRYVEVKACANLAEALALAHQAPFFLVTGSLHFIGEAMESLQPQPAPSLPEQSLNNWTSPKNNPPPPH